MIRKLFIMAALLILASAAKGQEPNAESKHGKLRSFFGYVGRHVKESFTDCKTDKLWCGYVIGVGLINAADTGETIVGMHRGFRETSPLFGPHPSTLRLVSESAGITVAHFTTMHMLRELFTDKCKSDAADPNSMYSRIAAKRGISTDPRRCTEAIDLLGWTAQPRHVAAIVGNINELTR